MSDTDRNNQIATKLRELADLFHGAADGAGPSTTEAAPAPVAKRGRPPKVAAAEPEPTKSEPIDITVIITDDHPTRKALVEVAKAYAVLTSLGDAQKAMKLFGESSRVVLDADLTGALVHFKNLVARLPKAAPVVEDDSI